jgi:hypothetical protein
MNEWHDFFLAQAGAAGVLTGLVFVGVSINLEKIVSDPSSGLAGRAAEALILLVAVLIASVLVLVPGQGAGVLGAEVLVVELAAWGWIVAIQLPRLREWGTMRARSSRSWRLCSRRGCCSSRSTARSRPGLPRALCPRARRR